jgi:polyisoprenoid-binding protein YceI
MRKLSFLCFFVACTNPAAEQPAAVVQPAAPVPAPAPKVERWPLTKTTIGFVGAKVTGSHNGGFTRATGWVEVANGAAMGMEVTVDMTSIYTDTEKLTAHLQSDDFFGVATHPEAKFVATQMSAATITGNLTLHGVTKSVTFPAQIHWGEHGVHAVAEFAINRKDFGVVYPGMPDDLIRDEVVLKLEVMAEGQPRT